MRPLAESGWLSITPRGINDAGQVVGRGHFPEGDAFTSAFITGPDGGGVTDLNSLVEPPTGLVFTHALAINNADQVLAIAIPEPESYALLLAGLALIGFMAQRKRTQNLAEQY